MSQNFLSDRAEGKRFEHALCTFFDAKGIPVWLNPAPEGSLEQAHYDIGINTPSGDKLIEAKMDVSSFVYGNFAVEGPTLEKSQADYFITGIVKPYIFTREQWYGLFHDKVQADTHPGMFYKYTHKNVGDGGKTPAAIVPLKYLQAQPNQPAVGTPLWLFYKNRGFI